MIDSSQISVTLGIGLAALSTSNAPLFVSVIIPVWNDPERLTKCLDALRKQTYPAHSYEIIVVDNGSAVPVDRVVASYGHARVVHEQRVGSYAARNSGLKVARGQVIAFTDADCLPAPDWIEKGVAHLKREGCMM